MTLSLGFHPKVSHVEYHSDPCERPSLSASIASILVDQSPAHAYLAHPRLGGEPFVPTTEMEHGSLCHEFILKSGREIAIGEWDAWRKNEAKDFKEQAQARGAIVTLRHKYAAAEETVANVIERLRQDHAIELDGYSECVLVWTEKADDGTEVLCRAQMDHYRPTTATVYDFKFAEDAHPETCRNKLVPMGYAIQRTAYVRAIEQTFPELVGRVEFEFLFCEIAKPYAVAPIQLAGSMLEVGELRWRRAVNLWAQCTKTGKWPAYSRRFAEARPYELQASYEAAS